MSVSSTGGATLTFLKKSGVDPAGRVLGVGVGGWVSPMLGEAGVLRGVPPRTGRAPVGVTMYWAGAGVEAHPTETAHHTEKTSPGAAREKDPLDCDQHLNRTPHRPPLDPFDSPPPRWVLDQECCILGTHHCPLGWDVNADAGDGVAPHGRLGAEGATGSAGPGHGFPSVGAEASASARGRTRNPAACC